MLFAVNHLAAEDTASTKEHIAALKAKCSQTSAERAARHEQTPLYERLGGYDKIHALTKEIVRLHLQNDEIKHLFEGVDADLLAKHVADFVAAGTGGSEEYTGRPMPTAHAGLELTDADFLSAGNDIVNAMQSMGYGQNEIDEILCILMSLKDQVVFTEAH
jgi:hemoglobin